MTPERVAQALLLLDLASVKLRSLPYKPSGSEVNSCCALGDRIEHWLIENNLHDGDQQKP
jgi:hypothetical protein